MIDLQFNGKSGEVSRLDQNKMPQPVPPGTFPSACLAVVLLIIHSRALRLVGFWKHFGHAEEETGAEEFLASLRAPSAFVEHPEGE